MPPYHLSPLNVPIPNLQSPPPPTLTAAPGPTALPSPPLHPRSSLIAQVPRVVWALDLPDPADPDHRRLAVIKNNLVPIPDPIGMRIDDDGLHFGPPPQPPTVMSQHDRAAAFLQDLLAGGPLPAAQVIAAAQAAGLSERTLNRAKQHLRIKSNKEPDQWTWQLPPA